MPTRPALTPPTKAFPVGVVALPTLMTQFPPPKKMLGFPTMQSEQTFTSTHEQEPLLSPRTEIPSIRLQSATNHNHDSISVVPQSKEEDEYTLSAYGDISLGDIIVPPLPPPTHGGLQQRSPQPRLRLKVRRPPMPKRRISYIYVPASEPLPHNEGMDPDERWPGSPRPFVNDAPWLQHQPLVSPLPADNKPSWTRGDRPVKNNGSSLEKLFDELVPRSPSIRLSPPGSPASQVLSLPRETNGQKDASRQARNVPKALDAAKSPQSSPTPAPRRDEPKEAPWRTRLPPRLPIPKWDM